MCLLQRAWEMVLLNRNQQPNFNILCKYTWFVFDEYFDILLVNNVTANHSGHAVSGVGLRPIHCRYCGFESHRRRGFPSLVSFVYCH